MYEQTFNLTSRPFTSAPFVKHYFAASSIKESLAQSRVAIDRGDGPVIVVGATGTGKSLLLAMLDDQYHSQYRVVNLGCSKFNNRGDFLQNILFELQQPYRDMSESEMRLALIEYLKPGDRCPNGILLLIDDADRFNQEILDEVRLITNFVRNGQPRIRLVMAGTNTLEESLTRPALESFNQRIACRTYLSKLSRDETEAYIKSHLERAGADVESMFDENAMRLVHEQSDGSPRFINQICDHAMIIAATRNIKPINCQVVSEAWADVQNLPGSWQPEQHSPAAELEKDENWTVLEFGSLDDDADSLAQESVASSESEPNAEPAAPAAQPSVAPVANILGAASQTIELGFLEEPATEIESLVQEQDELLSSVYGSSSNPSNESPTDAEPPSQAESTTAVPVQPQESEQVPTSPVGTADLETTDAAIPPTQPKPTSIPMSVTSSDTEPSESIEPNEPASTIPMQANDPFASDSFEDEELLADTYSPFVARQNQSSLEVTQDEVQFLQPIDSNVEQAPAPDSTTESQSETVAETVSEPESAQTPAVAPRQSAPTVVQETPMETVVPHVAADEHQPVSIESEISQHRAAAPTIAEDFASSAASSHDELAQVEEASNAIAPETTDTAPSGESDEKAADSFHVQASQPNDDEIRRQAEEIIKSLSLDTIEEELSQETAASSVVEEIASIQSAPVHAEQPSAPTPPSDPMSETAPEPDPEPVEVEAGYTANALNQSQAILQQIFEQQQLIGATQSSPDQPSSESDQESDPVSIQYPLAQPPGAEPDRSSDDRDMLVVSEQENNNQKADSTEEPLPPYSQEAPSSGRASRIDYQDLFNQLRNMSDE